MNYLSSIVLSNSADRVEKFAASELAKHIGCITNQQITPKSSETRLAPAAQPSAGDGSIYVGQLPNTLEESMRNQIANDLKELHDDGFIIKDIQGNLAICGKTPRATLYGVYHYLQLLGVRWYFPGRDYEFVPNPPYPPLLKGGKGGFELGPINIKESPDINKRGIVIHFSNSALRDWIDFAPKVKLNSIALHSDEGLHEMPDLLADRGVTLDFERHFFGDIFGSDDPAELEENRKQVKDYVQTLPECINDFFLWQADVWVKQADRDRERHYTISDSALQFMNKMLPAIREVRPEARLAFLAYLGTFQRPMFVKPVEGIFLEIAPMHRCFAHAIADPDCPINSRNVPATERTRQNMGVKSIVEELLEVFNPHEAQVLGYWLDASLFGRGRYQNMRGRVPQFGEIIKDDINYYRNLGISAITTFAVGIDKSYLATFTSPTIFQYATLLWDSQADLQSQLEDFCEHFYGDKDLANIFQRREHLDPIDPMPQYWKEYIDELANASSCIQPKLNATTDEKIRLRLERLRNEIDHVRCFLGC
ncbi:DUF4838 domain-containing protein [Candidatus Poribacteria bacterium]|nr:DUF4838 domain-containing protein [Candidatus Poribacteria bacterium]